jgi:hypothetical protein
LRAAASAPILRAVISRRGQIALAVVAVLALWSLGGILASRGTWWPLVVMLSLGGLVGIVGLGFAWYLRTSARSHTAAATGPEEQPAAGTRPKRRRRTRGGRRNRG